MKDFTKRLINEKSTGFINFYKIFFQLLQKKNDRILKKEKTKYKRTKKSGKMYLFIMHG